MTWVRTDDAARRHPKFFHAGVEAFGWWNGALGYCNENLTDGFIAASCIGLVYPGALPDRVLGVVETLVREVLLHRYTPGKDIACPHRRCAKFAAPVEGYLMHDYLDYQPSRAQGLRNRVASKRRKDAWKKRKRKERGTAIGTRLERDWNAIGTHVPVPVPVLVLQEVPPTGDAAAPVAGEGAVPESHATRGGPSDTATSKPARVARARRSGDKPPHPVEDTANREAVKAWTELFAQHRGDKPIIADGNWPRFCAQIAPIVKRVGLNETKALLDRMFKSTHLKVTTSDYSVRFFVEQVNRFRGRDGAAGSARVTEINDAGEQAKRMLGAKP